MSIFIDGLMVLVILAVWVGSSIWCAHAWVEDKKGKFLSTIVCIVMNSFYLGLIVQDEEKNPCIKYETQLYFDAATKMIMPIQVCVERGLVE